MGTVCYGAGLKAYDLLAGRWGIGTTPRMTASEVAETLPTIRTDRLAEGEAYFDGQFNDARLAV